MLTAEAKTIDDMIDCLQGAADVLRMMKDAGVVLDESSAIANDFARLITTNPAIAKKFDFEPEEAAMENDMQNAKGT